MSALTLLLHRHLWLAWGIILASLVVFGIWGADRRVPFAMLEVHPSTAVAGGMAEVSARVKRDVSRQCSMTLTRFLYDRDGFRHDMTGTQSMSADGIRHLEAQKPGMLAMRFAVPSYFPPGPAQLVAEKAYRCNPVHQFFPINATFTLPLVVVKEGQ
jgi:hypothetical protein